MVRSIVSAVMMPLDSAGADVPLVQADVMVAEDVDGDAVPECCCVGSGSHWMSNAAVSSAHSPNA
jgi:hypothetical protein